MYSIRITYVMINKYNIHCLFTSKKNGNDIHTTNSKLPSV